MEHIRHVDGPSRFAHATLERVSGYGDTHEVTGQAAEYLCDERGFFERVNATDAEFRDIEDEEDDVDDAGAAIATGDAEAFVDRTPVSDVADDIEDGLVDEVLDEIEAAEEDGRGRETVYDAIDDRREELED